MSDLRPQPDTDALRQAVEAALVPTDPITDLDRFSGVDHWIGRSSYWYQRTQEELRLGALLRLDLKAAQAERDSVRSENEALTDALGVAVAEKAALIAEICSTTWEYTRSVDGREMRRRAAGPWENVNG